ncbi:MAG: porin family protein [Deferribacteraceae bacterium]|jgi:hypothetical protein|nr:porin family protein [Deferribacteraceae bacterium]
MHRVKYILATIIFVSIFSMNAFALDFGVGASAFMPTESEIYDYGYQVEAHMDFGLIPALVETRISVSRYSATGEDAGFDYELSGYGGQALVVLAPAIPIVKPYLGVGYGIYSNEETIDGHGIETTNDSIGHGPVVKAGLGISILILDLSLDAQYYVNKGEDDDEDYSGYTVGLSAGISF